MKKVVIVTGNPGKVREIEAMAMGKINFSMHDLDIDEIQSLNLEKIVRHKAEQAYREIGEPIIVDDVSAGLDSLNGLPGPFIKYFNERAGSDILFRIAKDDSDRVTVTCLAAYYDGTNFIIGRGEFRGKLVTPRGGNGFGFDSCIVPEGEEKTMAEMEPEYKMKISHRGRAFSKLLTEVEKL